MRRGAPSFSSCSRRRNGIWPTQSLPMTLAVDSATVIVLDALRKQRNLTDYTGDGVSDALLAECIAQAESLLRHARATLGEP